MEKKTLILNKSFLQVKDQDLFMFLGRPLSNFSFESLQGTRSFVEHFEEYVRWEKAKDTELLREKYVLTNAHPKQTLTELTIQFSDEIAKYSPSVVTYVISKTDIEKQTSEQLFQLLKQVLQLKNNQAKCILLTPWAINDKNEYQSVNKYIDVLKTQLSELEADERNRVLLVNLHEMTALSEHIDAQGELTDKGHLELAKGFIQSVFHQKDDDYWRQLPLDLIFQKEKLVEETGVHQPNTALNERLKREKPLTWLFMGDSITHGALWTFGYKDYVELFTAYIKHSFNRPRDIFINTAVSGATIPSTLNRLETRLEPYQPDIVYMKLGANDVVSFTAAEYKENVKTILGHLQAKNALIILSTPTPSNIGEMEAERMREYVRVLSEIAKEYPELLFIDQFSALNAYLEEHPEGWKKDYTFYTDEVLHLGANGQLYMFHTLVKQLGLLEEDSPFFNYFYVSKEEDALIVKDVFHTLHQ